MTIKRYESLAICSTVYKVKIKSRFIYYTVVNILDKFLSNACYLLARSSLCIISLNKWYFDISIPSNYIQKGQFLSICLFYVYYHIIQYLLVERKELILA